MPTLKPFQQDGVDFLRENDYRALLADAPGTGKTIQVLTALTNDRRKLTPTLVIAPASVTQNWQDEARIWAPWARSFVISDETTPIPKIRLDIIICSWGLLASRLRQLAKLRRTLTGLTGTDTCRPTEPSSTPHPNTLPPI